jgi:hypothetical protein
LNRDKKAGKHLKGKFSIKVIMNNQRKVTGKGLVSMVVSGLMLSLMPVQAEEYLIKLDSDILTEEIKKKIGTLVEEQLIEQIIEDALIDQIVTKKLSDPKFLKRMKDEIEKRLVSMESDSPPPSSGFATSESDTSDRSLLPEHPEGSVTLVLVPQDKACRPNGYKGWYSRTRRCKQVTRDDVESWKNQHPSVKEHLMSQRGISLSSEMYDAVQYGGFYSVVMLFDFDRPQTGSITLTREDTIGKGKTTWTGSLREDNGWINHQNMVYFPPHKCRWTLQLGESFQWNFEIKNKHEN